MAVGDIIVKSPEKKLLGGVPVRSRVSVGECSRDSSQGNRRRVYDWVNAGAAIQSESSFETHLIYLVIAGIFLKKGHL